MADQPCLLVQLLVHSAFEFTAPQSRSLSSLLPHISPHLSYSCVQVCIFHIGMGYRYFEFCCFHLEVYQTILFLHGLQCDSLDGFLILLL